MLFHKIQKKKKKKKEEANLSFLRYQIVLSNIGKIQMRVSFDCIYRGNITHFLYSPHIIHSLQIQNK
jgi:hypothetical protein